MGLLISGRWLSRLQGVVAVSVLALWLGAGGAFAQPDAQAPAVDKVSAVDEIGQRIETVERQISSRRLALQDAAPDDPQLAALHQLLDMLKRSQESLRVAGELQTRHTESRQLGLREPGEYFSQPPPYSVPLLDAVFSSWAAQRRQSENLEQVVDHRGAEQEAARKDFEEAERERRRAKEELGRSMDELEAARVGILVQERELDSRIAEAELQLAEIELGNAQIEHAMQLTAEQQAAAVLAFVRLRLQPEDADLDDVLADLAKRKFDLDRALETTRLDLTAAAGRLDDVQARADAAAPGEVAVRAEELAARRLQFTASQRRVALLGERVQRLALAREAWKRRYAVLAGSLPPEVVREGLGEARKHIDDLGRQRRTKAARLAELNGELAELRGRILASVTEPSAERAGAEGGARSEALRSWLAAQERDLRALTRVYQEDLTNLDEVIALEHRLLDELEVHDKSFAVGKRIGLLREVADDWWDYELTSSEDRPITIGKVVTALIIFVMGWLFSGWLSRTVGAFVFRRMGLDPGAVAAFQSLLHYALLAVAFLLALRVVAIPLTAFAVLGGALAIGVGFGSQTVVSNFISGLILLAERPIKAGDYVEVEGIYGQVERIGLRSTRIRTGDNFHIIVPNAAFLERSVINWTHANKSIRLKVSVGVAYGSPTRRVATVLQEVVAGHERVLGQPEPVVLFLSFGDSSLVFEMRFWITVRDLMDRLAIESEIRHAIAERLAEEEIVIAFPQQDVHLDASGPIELQLRAAPADEDGG